MDHDLLGLEGTRRCCPSRRATRRERETALDTAGCVLETFSRPGRRIAGRRLVHVAFWNPVVRGSFRAHEVRFHGERKGIPTCNPIGGDG